MNKVLRWLALIAMVMAAGWLMDRVEFSHPAAPSRAPAKVSTPAPPATNAAPANPGARVQCLAYHSRILDRKVNFCVLLPPGYNRPPRRRYPVLYYLPGLGGSAEELVNSQAWMLIDDLWQGHQLRPFLIVSADSFNSFYINAYDGRMRYEDFFMRELPGWIGQRYRTLPGRRNRALLGISMGGYGALHLAFKYPQRFGSVSAHSAMLLRRPPVAAVNDPLTRRRLRYLGRIFGMPPNPRFWARNSPFTLAQSRRHLSGLKIEFDCGQQDDYGFQQGALELHRRLLQLGVPHEFHLYPGGHDWSYFAARLPAALQFAAANFAGRASR